MTASETPARVAGVPALPLSACEILDRRIAELEARLDELRTLRELLEPAAVSVLPQLVLPQPVRESTPAEPVPEPDPNVVRPAVAKTPAAKPKETPAKETPAKEGRPAEPTYATALQRERAVLVARALAGGPLTYQQLIEATKLDGAKVQEVLRRCGHPSFAYPERGAAACHFVREEGTNRAPWRLSELGRRELLTHRPAGL